jgi:hypothetical protein
MTDHTTPPGPLARLARWATTRPQVYVFYLLAVIAVWLLSFYAGTLKPKKTDAPPPAVTAPRN